MTLLEAIDISAGYDDMLVLHEVSIATDQQEIVSIVGPNGAGKSTLIKSIIGFVQARSGSVYFDKDNITSLRPDERAKRGISYVPQSDNIFPSLTVEENLEIGGHLNRDNYEEAKGEVFSIFSVLRERPEQQAGTLSGGQRQMLAMARALMAEPMLLLLDEPTAGVQPNLVTEILDLIHEINTDRGIGVLMVEQNARLALERSNKGYVLANGEVQFANRADNLLQDQEVVDTFVGE